MGGVENESGLSPTETWYKVGSSHKEEGLGELVFCLPASLHLLNTCVVQHRTLLWEKRIHPTGEAFERIPSSRADGKQFALCSKFWELGNFGPLHFFATNVPKMSGGLSGLGFLVSKIKGLNSNNTEELL